MKKIDIHPIVRKYWEKKDKQIHKLPTFSGDKVIYYHLPAGPVPPTWVSVTDPNVVAIYSKSFFNEDWNMFYYIGGHAYYEDIALRLLNIIVFL